MNRRGLLGLFIAAPALTLDGPLPKGAITALRPVANEKSHLAVVQDLLVQAADFPNADEVPARIGAMLRVRLPSDYSA